MVWDGAQLVPHSLALVNRELELALLETGRVELALLPRGDDAAAMAADPRFGPLRERYDARLSGPVDVYVRHCWPPDFDPPPAGAWVVIQPWEYGAIPVAWLDPVERLIDEVWVPSSHVRQAFLASGVAPDRVVVVPNGVNLRVFRPDAPPRPLGTERRCKLLFVGGTVLQRKGVDVLLKAYRQAFTRGDDICLVLKDLGSGWLYGGDVSRLLKPFQDDPDAPELLYLTDTLGDADMPGLYTACDALVHPFRGEGYGLPVAEALACGRPVVVTRGGACDDFCPDDATYWIPARRRTAGLEYEIAGEPWVLEPDVETLAAHLRAIYERPEEARARGRAGAAHAQQHLGWEQAARIALARLEVLSAEGRRGRSPRRARAASGAAPVTPSFAVEAEAVEVFRAGREHANAGRWDEALRELNRALNLNPLLASAHYLLGYVELQRGRPAEALRALRQAVELKPDAADFQSALGVALHLAGDDAAAEGALRRALALDDGRADVWANLGELYEAQERGDEAAAAYERALALAPGDAALAEALARVRTAADGDGLGGRDHVGAGQIPPEAPAGEEQGAAGSAPSSAPSSAPMGHQAPPFSDSQEEGDERQMQPRHSPTSLGMSSKEAQGWTTADRGSAEGASPPPLGFGVSPIVGKGGASARRRLNILVAGHHVPAYSSALLVSGLARAHNVLTVGPGWDEQTERGWLEAWREAPHIPQEALPRYVARMRERARPADLPFERGVCNVGAMWARLPAGWRPDLFVWIDCYGTFLPAGTGNLPCPTACLLGDTHVGLEPRIDYARNYRHVFLMFNRQHLPHFWAAGLPARWLPAACDPELHSAPPAAKRWDVGFAGQLQPRYYAERIRLLESLVGAGLSVRIDCGHVDEVARLFAASRLVFNRSLSQDLNMRVFEALAAGSLLLTNRLPDESGLDLLFRPGEHLVVYDDLDQLVGLARWYIGHDGERERMARAGQAEVLAKHTYAHRADQLLSEVFGPAAAELAPCAPAPAALPPYDDLSLWTSRGAQPRRSPLPALDLDALLTLAQEHVAAGAWDAAAEALNRALDRDPLAAPAQYLLGCVELQRGRPAVALRALRQAADLAPDAADFQSALGVALHATGDDTAAEATLRRALDLDGGRADVWTNLGELCEAHRRWAEAAAAYERALALTSGDAALAEAMARVRAAGEAAAKQV
ncbi:MAG: tetratricopeptide repeat protein [Chloroflexi bacterium]|nr:tetratricopeptide repeat protein [Chloroflexota bacterium]